MKVVKTPQGFVLMTDMGNPVGTFATEEQANQQKSAAEYKIHSYNDYGQDKYHPAKQEAQYAPHPFEMGTPQPDKWYDVPQPKNPNKPEHLLPPEASFRRQLWQGSQPNQTVSEQQALELPTEEIKGKPGKLQKQENLAGELYDEAAHRQGRATPENAQKAWLTAAQAYDKVYSQDPTLHHALAAARAYEFSGQKGRANAVYLGALKRHGGELSKEQHQLLNDRVLKTAQFADEIKPDKIGQAPDNVPMTVEPPRGYEQWREGPMPGTAAEDAKFAAQRKAALQAGQGVKIEPPPQAPKFVPGPSLEYRGMDVFPNLSKPDNAPGRYQGDRTKKD